MQFDLSGKHVHIGLPYYADPAPQTAMAICATCLELAREGVTFSMSVKWGNCYVDQVRSIIAREFLQTKAQYLFMIDADMLWEPKDFLQVLAHATVMDCVSVAYRMKEEAEKYTVCIPNPATTNEYGCVPLLGGGLGFCCVQRKVIEALSEKAECVNMGQWLKLPWLFRCRPKDGFYQGEDMAFFDDLRDAGFEPYLDMNVSIGHLGRKDYRGSLAETLERDARINAERDESTRQAMECLAAI